MSLSEFARYLEFHKKKVLTILALCMRWWSDLAKKYELNLPKYPDSDQIVELET